MSAPMNPAGNQRQGLGRGDLLPGWSKGKGGKSSLHSPSGLPFSGGSGDRKKIGGMENYLRSASPARSHVNTNLSSEGEAVDRVELSGLTEKSLRYAKAEFQINYQCIRSISDANGTSYEEMNFSLSGSYTFLQATCGQAPDSLPKMDSSTLMERLKEIFSPEATAQRILDFALSWYNPAEGQDTVDARTVFAREIGGAVQKGFDQAADILGVLDEEIQKGIDKTHKLVFGGLDEFLKNGRANGSEEKTRSIRSYAESWQASVQLKISTVEEKSLRSEETALASSVEPFDLRA